MTWSHHRFFPFLSGFAGKMNEKNHRLNPNPTPNPDWKYQTKIHINNIHIYDINLYHNWDDKTYIIRIRSPDMMIKKKTLYQLISHKIDRIYHRCARCIKQLRRLQRPVSRRPCRIDLPKSWTTGGSTRCWTPGIFITGKHHRTAILQNVGPPVYEIAKLVNTSPRTMVYGTCNYSYWGL